jgi:ABC-type transport system involved in cytochrome c biogenesis ATPase subunit
MRVNALYLENFRSFESRAEIEFDQITVLIGPNNAGKSSILRALYLLQNGSGDYGYDIRNNASYGELIYHLQGINGIKPWAHIGELRNGILTVRIVKGSVPSLYINKGNGMIDGVQQLPNREPDHYIVPYLSRRKTAIYNEDVKEDHALTIRDDLSFLAAKLSRLSNPTFPEHESYRTTCKAILGFMVTAIPSGNGQRAGVYCSDGKTIFIDQMGEGVPNIVGLLANLALSQNKLFLIEEPENDLHPKALKALLDLIIEKSESNQFVVSTHSNIVVRHLAAISRSKLYHIKTTDESHLPPKTIIRFVEPTAEARLEVLQELGYSLSDFDLWDGWLILEESSAELIIRDYLIPWFAPSLTRIRSLSVRGIDQIESTFEDFNRLVRFTHLEEVYRNVAWVRVDGDTRGIAIIERLKSCYPNWNKTQFGYFAKTQFEYYYPEEFTAEIAKALAQTDKQIRRQAKKHLLENVCAWLDSDQNRGREALEQSASEIIEDLRFIETQIIKKKRCAIPS